jgi:hypothetical protein
MSGRVVGGAVLGAFIGFIVALNVVIFSGAERGYETSLSEVFDQSLVLGGLVVMILLAGPIVGAVIAWRGRDRPPVGDSEAHRDARIGE